MQSPALLCLHNIITKNHVLEFLKFVVFYIRTARQNVYKEENSNRHRETNGFKRIQTVELISHSLPSKQTNKQTWWDFSLSQHFCERCRCLSPCLSQGRDGYSLSYLSHHHNFVELLSNSIQICYHISRMMYEIWAVCVFLFQ